MKIQSSIKSVNSTTFDINDTIVKNISLQNQQTSNNKISFNNVLSENIIISLDLQLKELLSKIDSQKDNLIKNRNMIELRKYKSLISDFFQIINNKFNIKEQIYYDRYGKQKILTNIENVNSKLKELTSQFLKDNKNDIYILNLVDEVKGLLVDSVI